MKEANRQQSDEAPPTEAALVPVDSGFRDTAPIVPIQEVGAVAAAVREEADIKAAVASAKKFHRNELSAYKKLIDSCTTRPRFAESAMYRFKRGGQDIVGPSVDLAREAARCWTNIRYGLRIVSDDEDRVHIMGWAYDVEANNFVSMEDKFKKLVQRKSGWVRPDERDLRELINRRGAICVRNAILQVLPPDVIDDAMAAAKDTVRKAVAGEFRQNKTEALRRITMAFSDIGVSIEMLEVRLKHAVDLITEEEIVELRQIYKSISDGNSRREEHFELRAPVAAAQGTPGEATGSIDMSAAAEGTPPPPREEPKAEPAPGEAATEPKRRGRGKSDAGSEG